MYKELYSIFNLLEKMYAKNLYLTGKDRENHETFNFH